MIKNGPKYAEGIPVDEVHVSLLSVQAARSSEGNLYTIQNSDFVIVGRMKHYWKFQRFWLIFGACIQYSSLSTLLLFNSFLYFIPLITYSELGNPKWFPG